MFLFFKGGLELLSHKNIPFFTNDLTSKLQHTEALTLTSSEG